MIIVLMIAAVVSWLVSGDLADAVVIMIVVILNAIMGVFKKVKPKKRLMLYKVWLRLKLMFVEMGKATSNEKY